MILSIIEGIYYLLQATGLWENLLSLHNQKAAKNAQNEVAVMSAAELDKRVQSDITHK